MSVIDALDPDKRAKRREDRFLLKMASLGVVTKKNRIGDIFGTAFETKPARLLDRASYFLARALGRNPEPPKARKFRVRYVCSPFFLRGNFVFRDEIV